MASARSRRRQEPEAVGESFDAEIGAIKEREKEYKGETKAFYHSIVERVVNWNQMLIDLRKEHTSLRKRLADCVRMKAAKTQRQTLEADLRHKQHEVFLLQEKIDRVTEDRSRAIEEQKQLERVAQNLRLARSQDRASDDRVREMRDKLDRANIKNAEAIHLKKVYLKICDLLEQQRARCGPVVGAKQKEISQRDRDIGELSLIARDSRFSCANAKTEYIRAKKQVESDAAYRQSMLEQRQAIALATQQTIDYGDRQAPSRPTQSIGSTPSVLRAKQNKAQRDRKEEKFRQVSAQHDEISAFFGTSEAGKISQFFSDRADQAALLEKKGEELKVENAQLQQDIDRLRQAVDEAEYLSAKGVGARRLVVDGGKILAGRKQELADERARAEASAHHRRGVTLGVNHVRECLRIVDVGQEPVQGPAECLRFCKERIAKVQDLLRDEETEWVAHNEVIDPVDPEVLVLRKLVEDGVEEDPKKVVKPPKKAKEGAKVDLQARVQDRNAIKAAAARAAAAARKPAPGAPGAPIPAVPSKK